jgi:pantoate--beta-alanine ligase
MEIFKHISPLKAFLKERKLKRQTVGLVPTMGALHPGHLALVGASKNANDVTVSSIYVNPAQFNNIKDLEKYPRTLERDASLLEKVGCDVLFAPDNVEMYPQTAGLKFDFGPLDKVMEGQFRPGHFSGVALVVSKLFHIVEPDNAYFGRKDFQQFAVIRQLVTDLSFNLTLHCVDTLREADGLAMSSRNLRLNAEERQLAIVFYKALQQARQQLKAGATVAHVKSAVRQMIETQPHTRFEYFEVADPVNLNALDNVREVNQPILCIAGYIGEIRLIDNMFLD